MALGEKEAFKWALVSVEECCADKLVSVNKCSREKIDILLRPCATLGDITCVRE